MNLTVLKVIRFLHLIDKPTYNLFRYTTIIENSPYMDSEWYIKTYKLPNNTNAARDYIEVGASKGRNPSPKFSTQKYYETCPDVKKHGMNPLVHYELHGKHEGRCDWLKIPHTFNSYGTLYHVLRKISRRLYAKKIQQNQSARILVHFHLFYTSSWCEIKEYFDNLSCYKYDLIVTCRKEYGGTNVFKEIKKYKPDCKIIRTENKGFDIAPFIDLLKDVDLKKYDIIYHLHTKSVAGKSGRLVYNRLFCGKSWFHQLFGGTLGVFNVHKGIDALMHNKKIGMIAAKNLIFTDTPERQALVKQYADRLGIEIPENYHFIGGTCFGVKSDLLEPLKKLNLTMDSFQPSRRYIFTLAHAMERLMSIIILNQHYCIKGLYTPYNNHPLKVHRLNAKKAKEERVILKQLQKFGVTDPKTLKLDMHSGIGCSFFKGFYKGKEVFIKYGGDPEVAQNECTQQKHFKKILGVHVSEILAYDPHPFIIMEYMPGYNLDEMINFGLTSQQKKDILTQLVHIKKVLLKSNLLHRDIRPANLFYSDGILKLIDFQFAVTKTKRGKFKELDYLKQNPDKLKVLGDIYRAAPDKIDDIASIQKIIEEVEAL